MSAADHRPYDFDIRCPDSIVSSSLSDAELRVWLAIRSFQGSAGRSCSARGEAIAERCGKTRNFVYKVRNRLLEKGYLFEAEDGGFRCSIPLDDTSVYDVCAGESHVPEKNKMCLTGTQCASEEHETTCAPEEQNVPQGNMMFPSGTKCASGEHAASALQDEKCASQEHGCSSQAHRSFIRIESQIESQEEVVPTTTTGSTKNAGEEGDEKDIPANLRSLSDKDHLAALLNIPVPLRADVDLEPIEELLAALSARGANAESARSLPESIMDQLYRETFGYRPDGTTVGSRGRQLASLSRALVRRWPWHWIVVGYHVASSYQNATPRSVPKMLAGWESDLLAAQATPSAGSIPVSTASEPTRRNTPPEKTRISEFDRDRYVSQGFPPDHFEQVGFDGRNKPVFLYLPK